MKHAFLRMPTVHLNGSSKDDLINQYLSAAQAVFAAMESVDKAAPNARDYYPAGDHAFKEAAAEHRERAQALRRVYDELMAITEYLSDLA